MKKAFAVVGHSHWGKSWTLRALTDDAIQYRYWTIKETQFRIKRMSNDDDPEGLLKFISKLGKPYDQYLIYALCPNFNKNEGRSTDRILNNLHDKGYKLHFWVIQHQSDGDGIITAQEISELKKYGHVEVYSNKVDEKHRAKYFEKYVTTNL